MFKKLLYALVVMLATTQVALADRYKINVIDSEGGSVTVSKMSGYAEDGDIIKVFIQPESEIWALQSLAIVRDDNGTDIEYAPYASNYEAYSFTMPASDVTITPTFGRAMYIVTVINTDEGGYADADVDHAAPGATVTVRTYPLNGYRTSTVTVTETETATALPVTKTGDNVYTFVLTASDVEVRPVFAALPEIPIITDDTENGTVTTQSSGYEDQTVSIFATPDMGYEVDQVNVWQFNNGVRTPVAIEPHPNNTYFFTMPGCESVTVNVTFKKCDYFVIIDSDAERGTVSEAVPGEAHHFGDEVTVTVTPAEDYTLKHLTLSDPKGNELEFTWLTEGSLLKFTMPYGNVTVHATFRYSVYDIEIADSELGTVTSDVPAARAGETVILTITPDIGCMLTDITAEAGYYIQGGSGGGVHAPKKAQALWYSQGKIFVDRIDATHCSIELPEAFADDITPNYLESTKIRINATFKDVGARVIWCEGNSTLYFDYVAAPLSEPQAGDQFNGETITQVWTGKMALPVHGMPYWNNSISSEASNVVILPSFADARPTSCYWWFKSFSHVQEFVGLEYLNTSQVTDMTSMFDNCWSLKKINVNNFDMTNVTNVSKMFLNCSTLTTIFCDNTWNIANSDNMFSGDTYLVGASSYRDKGISDGSMANPDDGYFTASHTVTLVVEGNGTAQVPEIGFPGTTITINATPVAPVRLGGITVTGDNSGNAIEITQADGAYTFTMPGEPVTVTVTYVTPEIVDAVLWCADNTSLYFVRLPVDDMTAGTWDGQTVTQSWYGNAVTNVGYNIPAWNDAVSETVTRVVFDNSFADARPKSCYGWFYQFTQLTDIENLENLNMSSVTNTNSMFLNCSSLTTIDVNCFDMSHVNNATGMFRSCSSLTTIYCDNTWNINTAQSMFLGCKNLKGAAAYSATATTGAMANPLTGYFTTMSDIIIAETSLGTVTSDYDQAYTNTVVTITVEPANERIFSSGLRVVGNVTGNEIVNLQGYRSSYTFDMPGESVTVYAQLVQWDYTLAEALQQDNSAELSIVEPIIVVEVIGTHAYVTDGEDHWARLDLEDFNNVRKGDNISHFDGVLANRDTAPTFTLSEGGSMSFSHDGVETTLMTVDLANGFDMPAPCQVVVFTGYYFDGELRGFNSSGNKGQSLTLDTEFSGPLAYRNGEHVQVTCGVELKEPWQDSESAGAPRRARSSYDYDFQNLNGKVISSETIDTPTAIGDIAADSLDDAGGPWYTIDGRLLGGKPTTPGIYIHGNRKVMVK